jgi:hypothetical protein
VRQAQQDSENATQTNTAYGRLIVGDAAMLSLIVRRRTVMLHSVQLLLLLPIHFCLWTTTATTNILVVVVRADEKPPIIIKGQQLRLPHNNHAPSVSTVPRSLGPPFDNTFGGRQTTTGRRRREQGGDGGAGGAKQKGGGATSTTPSPTRSPVSAPDSSVAPAVTLPLLDFRVVLASPVHAATLLTGVLVRYLEQHFLGWKLHLRKAVVVQHNTTTGGAASSILWFTYTGGTVSVPYRALTNTKITPTPSTNPERVVARQVMLLHRPVLATLLRENGLELVRIEILNETTTATAINTGSTASTNPTATPTTDRTPEASNSTIQEKPAKAPVTSPDATPRTEAPNDSTNNKDVDANASEATTSAVDASTTTAPATSGTKVTATATEVTTNDGDSSQGRRPTSWINRRHVLGLIGGIVVVVSVLLTAAILSVRYRTVGTGVSDGDSSSDSSSSSSSSISETTTRWEQQGKRDSLSTTAEKDS